jgi:alkylation response protein AidB-like acyl-CoA dehydrogenase
MDALLNDEQEALHEMATDLANDLATNQPHDLETELGSRGWKALADSGLLGLHLPADVGGAGASCVEVAIVAEQLGRTLAREPYVGTLLAVELAHLAGADEFAGRLAENQARATITLTPELDAVAGLGAAGVAWDAAGADQALLLDAADLVAVDLTTAEVVSSIDVTRVVRRIDAAAEPTVLGRLDADGTQRWLAFSLAILAADLVGVMDGALARAVRYAGEREQFGVPIGSFQAIAHLCADQAVTVSAARSAMRYAAWCIDECPPDEALRAARTAKAYASEVARTVTEAGIQVHGGIGITWECMAHLYLRRVLLSRQVLGDGDHQLARLAADREAA